MNVVEYNSRAWDEEAKNGCQWSQPVEADVIAAAKRGDWNVHLTAGTPVPKDWFPNLKGLRLLALASGGGQQAPIFAAVGASVTVFDNSKEQLDRDRLVATRDGLQMAYEQGDMADLSRFSDESFDFIYHPVSNCYVEDVKPVWKECFRVLAPGGSLISGFLNPVFFMLDHAEAQKGIIHIRHATPYSDLTSISEMERKKLFEADGRVGKVCFGHSLTDQIGGQTAAGFVITGFLEDYGKDSLTPLNKLTPVYIRTRALKPHANGIN